VPFRVYELARDLGLESKVVLQRAADLGILLRSASSPLSDEAASKLRRSYGDVSHRVSGQGRTTAGWQAGAINPPTDDRVRRSIDAMCSAFPTMAAHRRILRQLGSEIVYAGYVKEPKFSECAVALIRFSGAIESAFGLTREVLFFYSPHRDTQIRTYHAARQALDQVPRQVTPDLIFFWSSDHRLKPKLDDWSSGGFMAIPLLLAADEDPISFISLLRDYIFARDLFYETTPVRGERFFGRKTLLQGIRDDLRNSRVAGIYGLRKAGKTSVLTQLQMEVDSDLHIVVLQDLESLPSPPIDPVPQLLRDIRDRVLSRLREHGYPSKVLGDLPVGFGLDAFKLAMSKVLRDLERKGARLTLLLDEIEYLTPSDSIDVREGPMPSVAQFLGTLRSLVQENDNFTFLLSGLTSAITESGRLYGRPNPLFSWAKAYYVSPLNRLEADDMAKTVGSRMGIRISSEALTALYDASGGHAFLYRHLASHVTTHLPLDVFERSLTGPDVLRALESWRRIISGVLREMLDHVERYYPEEAFLLEVLRTDPAYFASIADDEPLAVGHLLALGLITGDSRRFELSAMLDMM
jgi:hypothetical protein